MSWAEEQDWFGTEDMVLDAQERANRARQLITQGIWLQSGGVPIALTAMTYSHLCNCINMIENGRLNRPWALPYLRQELKKRIER